MREIDDRVTVFDARDGIDACCGNDPADYENIKVRHYTVIAYDEEGEEAHGFTFRVDEAGLVTSVSEPKQLVEGVDIP